MTAGFELRCARPERLADCVHPQLASLLADRAARVVYPAIDGTYLEDLGDDPERADEWASGDERWIAAARSAYRTLAARGTLSPARITRRLGRWSGSPEADIPGEVLTALQSFGTDPILWAPVAPRRLTTSELAAALDDAAWWVAHGYKEAFLVVGAEEPNASPGGAAWACDAAPFRPHRVRAHRSTSGRGRTEP